MANKNSQSQNDFKKFAENIRRTAIGVKFAKNLFTDPSSLSPKQITDVMRSFGLNIPQELVMTAEVAQVLVAGQAVYDGYKAYQVANTAADIKSATNTTALGTKFMTQYAEANGFIDADTASCVRIGTSVAMIIASAGTDAASWASLALEVAMIGPGKQGQADLDAYQNLQANYSLRMSPQAQILGSTFKDFQEKKISIYGVIAKMAAETPDLWPQVIKQDSPFVDAFPELMMLPVVPTYVQGHGEAAIKGDYPWPASGSYVIASWSSDRFINFQTLGKSFNKETSAEYFFELLLKPWIISYAMANQEIVKQGNMSMANIAALSYIVNPSGEISDRDDYVKFLIGSCLTPDDFGDPILRDISTQFVNDYYKGVDTTFHEQAISTGVTKQNQGFAKYNQDMEVMRQKLERVSQSGDIVELVQYEYIYKKLQSYMDFQQVSFEKDPSLGKKLNGKFSTSSVRAWRSLHNYIAVLNMIDMFRTDSYLSTTQFAQKLAPFMPSVDAFQQQVDRLSFLSTGRSINRLALKNIADFVGVDDVTKLVKVNKDELGAAIFTVK